MARPKMTEAEKLERKRAKQQLKIQQREEKYAAARQKWAEEAEKSRQEFLAALDPEKAAQLVKSVKFAVTSNNDFIKSILTSWNRFGKLSDSQMTNFISTCNRESHKVAVAETIETFFEEGGPINMTVQMNHARQKMETDFQGRLIDTIMSLGFVGAGGVRMVVKTNNKKLIAPAQEAFDKKLKVKISGKVKNIFPNSDTIYLNPRGLKIECLT